MKDDNDKMLQQFFSSAAERQIADDGFSEAVLYRINAIDKRMICLSHIWTLICCVGGIAFLVYSDAFSKLLSISAAEACRGTNDVMAHVMSGLKFVSMLNLEQIPQFVYLMPLAATAVATGVMIKESNR